MSTVRKAFALLPAAARRRWVMLVPLALAGAAAEAIGAASLYALIRVIGDPSAAARFPVVSAVYRHVHGDRAIVLSFAVLLALFYVGKNLVQVWQTYAQSALSAEGRAEIARRTLGVYLRAPWAFHLRRNSSELIRNVNGCVEVLFRRVLAPAVALAAELLVVLAIATVLVFMAPGVTVALLGVLGLTGALLLRVTRSRAERWGRRTHELEREVLQGTRQTLAAVKEITVLGREGFFLDEFARRQGALVRLRHLSDALAALPRLLVESVFILGAFALVMVVVLIDAPKANVVPLLGLYAYSGFRIVPSANRIIMYVNEIRASTAAVNALYADLATAPDEVVPGDAALPLHETIALAGVSFTYDGASRPALADVALTIRRGESVGVVGSTGSGKSTLVDVLIGLLAPTTGRVLVDGEDLRERARAWQRTIGYVPQAVVLVDDTLARNIALGIPDAQVDVARVRDAIRVAQLEGLVASLPEGLATTVGERGLRLSGGERQRIGIARALYHRPEVLVLDEATSALDNHTEAEVLRAMRGAATLVVIAHRLTSLEPCDRLVFLRDGRIAGSGTYAELLRDNAEFRRMAAAEPAL